MSVDLSAEQVLKKLMAGNARYVDKHTTHPHQSAHYRASLTSGQHPIAVILGCADSRVPPELLFDQGFGDLFVIRVAGNVVVKVTIASVEYAVAELGVPLVMVLGHSSCGAVQATLSNAVLPSHLPDLVSTIRPAVKLASEIDGDLLENAVKSNARLAASKLISWSEIIEQAVAEDRLRVIAAYYDLETGHVQVLDN